MSDYISREAICLTDFEIAMCNGDYKELCKMILDKIANAPAADVVPLDYHERCLQIEVEKRLALELQMPRWIPVTERLIHSGWYLAACNEWGGSAVRKAIYDEATRKWLEFPCGGPKDITKFVTHYMLLPQPPKEEGS